MFIERLIKALSKHQVTYAVVGGYAVALHGAIRGTVDIDLVIALDKRQYVALEKAMKSLGLVPRLPVDAETIFDFREEYMRNRNLVAWSFYHPANPLEVIDVLITQDLRAIGTVTKRIGKLDVVVAAIPDLITMKKQSARPQDLEDIRALEKLQ